MAELAVAYVQIVPSIKGISGAIENAIGAKPYKLPEPPVESWGTKIRGVLGGAFSAVKNVGVAAFAAVGASIAANLGSAISRVDTLNNFPRQMVNMGYSAQDAQASIKRLSEGIQGLPTTLDGIVGTAQSLAPLTGSLGEATKLSLALNNAFLASGRGSAEAQRGMAQLTQMFASGTVDMQSWRTVMETMPGQLRQLAHSMLGPSGNAQSLYSALQSGEISMKDFQRAIIDLNNNGGEGFESFAQQARDATGGIATSFTNVKTAISRGIANIIQAIGPDTFTTIATTLSSAIDNISGVIIDFITTIDSSSIATSFGDILPVIGALAGALAGLASHLPFIGSLFQGLTGPVGLVVGVMAGMIANSASLRTALGHVFQTIGQLVAQVAPLVSQLLPSISILLAALGDALAPIIIVIGQLAQALIPILLPAIQTIIGALADVTPVIAAVIASLGELAAWIAGQLMPIIEALLPVVQTILAGITGIVSGALEVIKGVVTTVMAVIKGDWAGAWNGIKSIVTGAWQIISSAVSSGISAVVQLVTTLPGKILGVLGNLGSLLYDSGRSLLQGLWNGISSAVGWVKDKISGALSSIRNLFPFSPAKEGPFSGKGWVLYSGLSIGEAMADGISRSTPRAVRAARGLSALTHEALDHMAHTQDAMHMPDVYSAGVSSFSRQQGDSVINIAVNVRPEDLAGLRSVQEFVERAGEWATVKGAV